MLSGVQRPELFVWPHIMLSSLRCSGLSCRLPSVLAANPLFIRFEHRVSSFRRPFSITCSRRQQVRPQAEKENIYTIPNVLTLSRIFACPVLGWSILEGNYHLASGLLVYAGLTDLVR